jgi:structure-specific endonuclease subunit SLX1
MVKIPVIKQQEWYVYILVSFDNIKTYVGITINPIRRLQQHNGVLKGGAKCTKALRPWKFQYVCGPYDNRATAAKLEYEIKQLSKEEKLKYVNEKNQTPKYCTT